MKPEDFPTTISELLALPEWDTFIESKLGNDLFISDPERAERIHDAAEDGCDGSTHAEVIEDWREFADQIQIDYTGYSFDLENEAEAEEFDGILSARYDALMGDIDDCEAFHTKAGTLHEQIG